jgi:hypothetical protein
MDNILFYSITAVNNFQIAICYSILVYFLTIIHSAYESTAAENTE